MWGDFYTFFLVKKITCSKYPMKSNWNKPLCNRDEDSGVDTADRNHPGSGVSLTHGMKARHIKNSKPNTSTTR